MSFDGMTAEQAYMRGLGDSAGLVEDARALCLTHDYTAVQALDILEGLIAMTVNLAIPSRPPTPLEEQFGL